MEINDLSLDLEIDKDIYPIPARSGYVVIFLDPQTRNYMFLAFNADIPAICYSDRPYLSGTRNPKYAKFYADADAAKSDIYMLRYYHRQFLKIPTIIKSATKIESNKTYSDTTLENTKIYYLDTTVDPLEN